MTMDGTLTTQMETYRPLLFSIAYRMTGSASDAEDLVQEAYLRALTSAPVALASPKAYLTTIISRLALDYLKSARVQREDYAGEWLPEPVLTRAPAATPGEVAEDPESLSMAFLVLLEALTPPERAVLLLHKVFDYPFAEIATMLEIPTATCRQHYHRAQAHIAEHRHSFDVSPDAHRKLLSGFLAAASAGNVEALARLLATDVMSWSDGGGKVQAAVRPIAGRDRVARFIVGIMQKAPDTIRFDVARVNGEPALLIWLGESLLDVVTFELSATHIVGIRLVLNPDKLAYLTRQLTAPDIYPPL
jgi:RNA polymerase sigma-70 factor (ECF subfamily)